MTQPLKPDSEIRRFEAGLCYMKPIWNSISADRRARIDTSLDAFHNRIWRPTSPDASQEN